MSEQTRYFLINLQAYMSGSSVHQGPSSGLLCSLDGIWDLKYESRVLYSINMNNNIMWVTENKRFELSFLINQGRKHLYTSAQKFWELDLKSLSFVHLWFSTCSSPHLEQVRAIPRQSSLRKRHIFPRNKNLSYCPAGLSAGVCMQWQVTAGCLQPGMCQQLATDHM